MIPNYQTCMLPLLKLLSDEKVHKFSDVVETLSDEFSLTDEERRLLIPSKVQTVISSRIGWAKTYMKKALLLEDTGKGLFKITERGKEVLRENPEKITTKDLKKFDEFKDFFNNHNSKKKDVGFQNENPIENSSTPDELLDEGYKKLTETLADDLVNAIAECSPSFFEKLVVDLLVHMGYGGSFEDAAKVVGKSGDEGIDGIIKEDRLGLDSIYIQAKRWKGSVGRPEIQKFAGALLGQKASKGVFITTGNFTSDAESFAKTADGRKMVLIDGGKLASLMIEYNVGVSTRRIIEIKKIDSDYFEE